MLHAKTFSVFPFWVADSEVAKDGVRSLWFISIYLFIYISFISILSPPVYLSPHVYIYSEGRYTWVLILTSLNYNSERPCRQKVSFWISRKVTNFSCLVEFIAGLEISIKNFIIDMQYKVDIILLHFVVLLFSRFS